MLKLKQCVRLTMVLLSVVCVQPSWADEDDDDDVSPQLADDYSPQRTAKYLFGSDVVYFGVEPQPEHTCDYYWRHLKFDATTPGGKNMLGILLAAMATDQKIDVWYKRSTVPGVDAIHGCKKENMAVLTEIGIR